MNYIKEVIYKNIRKDDIISIILNYVFYCPDCKSDKCLYICDGNNKHIVCSVDMMNVECSNCKLIMCIECYLKYTFKGTFICFQTCRYCDIKNFICTICNKNNKFRTVCIFCGRVICIKHSGKECKICKSKLCVNCSLCDYYNIRHGLKECDICNVNICIENCEKNISKCLSCLNYICSNCGEYDKFCTYCQKADVNIKEYYLNQIE